jgi:sugar O-acyltransferase (sialic acid O-acetyltransferase NeuD family)
MKELIIIGAGGFGRELFHLSKECLGYEDEYKVVGFIDDNVGSLKNYLEYPPVLGTIESHHVTENQVFICSISDVQNRLAVINSLLLKGAKFINLVHATARVVKTSKLGIGCIVGPLVSIGADVIIGDFCLFQTGVIVGHDVKIGENSRIDNYSILVAGVKLEKNTTIHSNSVVNANVVVCEGAIIGACSFVVRNVKPSSTVHGNPAKILFK